MSDFYDIPAGLHIYPYVEPTKIDDEEDEEVLSSGKIIKK